jgi:hypothetical protein
MNSARLTVWQPEKALPLEQVVWDFAMGNRWQMQWEIRVFSGIFNGLFFKFNGTS